MSSMKSYIDQFRVSAGLAPDDRVLTKSLLAEDAETQEMERKIMAALEASPNKWGFHEVEWTGSVDPTYGDRRSVDLVAEMQLNVARPSVTRRKDGGFNVVVYIFGSEDSFGKIDRNKSSLALALKAGMSRDLLDEARTEPPLDPPDYGETQELRYQYSKQDRMFIPRSVAWDMEEVVERVVAEVIPEIIRKDGLPNYRQELVSYNNGGSMPNHYGWVLCDLQPKNK